MRVAIQPCGDSDAQRHYVDTIATSVAASRILPHLIPEDRADFVANCGANVAVWGVTPGDKNLNKNKWEKLSAGDIALLYRNKRIFSQGRISLLVHNRALALDLWGENADSETWEYIYFLDDLQEIEIPVAKYNAAMGYSPNAIIQGFNVFDEIKAARLIDLLELDLDSEPSSAGFTLDFDSIAAQLAAIQSMDLDAKGQARAEAGPLRAYLFGGKRSDRCDICGRELPVGLLVAAHIKKRASCTDAEKRDPHIVMRACKLGCDELFERGYISIDSTGNVLASSTLVSTPPDLVHTIRNLGGLKCGAFSDCTQHYFQWHREHPRRVLG